MKPYIHQKEGWPSFNWETESIVNLLGEVRNLQGKIVGKMGLLSFNLKNEAVLETLTLDAIKSTEIEGEILNLDQVQSSLAKRLKL